MDKLQLYDAINTTAASWINYNAKINHGKIGLMYFNHKDKTHLWLLNILKAYSTYNIYCKYYIKTNIFIYLYYKYFKYFKHLSRNAHNVFWINPDIFIKEVAAAHNCNQNIIIDIYNTYYKE